MNFQLVLFSGLGFLLLAGFCLFLLSKANDANLSERYKKLLMWLTVMIMLISCIFIFDTYTTDYIARNTIAKSQ